MVDSRYLYGWKIEGITGNGFSFRMEKEKVGIQPAS
jgi:hypothetical protein